MFKNKNILIAQGGGPTNVINMSLVSILEQEKKLGSTDIGSLNGVNGIINNRFTNLNKVSSSDLKLIAQTPGAALGSTRDKPDAKYCFEILEVLIFSLNMKDDIYNVYMQYRINTLYIMYSK